MIFGDGGFAQQVGGDGNVHAFGHFHGDVGEAETVQLDAGEDDGFFGGAEHGEALVERFLEDVRLGLRLCGKRDLHGGDLAIDHVVGDFDIHRPLVAKAGLDTAGDFGGGGLLVEKNC